MHFHELNMEARREWAVCRVPKQSPWHHMHKTWKVKWTEGLLGLKYSVYPRVIFIIQTSNKVFHYNIFINEYYDTKSFWVLTAFLLKPVGNQLISYLLKVEIEDKYMKMQSFETMLPQSSTRIFFGVQICYTTYVYMFASNGNFRKRAKQKFHEDKQKKVYEKPLQPLVLPLNMFTVIKLRPHFLMKHHPLPWDCSGKEWVHDPLHDMGTHTWDWGAISGSTPEWALTCEREYWRAPGLGVISIIHVCLTRS